MTTDTMTTDTKELILVTGASRGLGFAMARALASPERHIIAVARTVGGLEELDDAVQAKGGSATLVPLDLTDEGGLQNMGASIYQRWGRLDGFVHCAAHAPPLAPVGHIDAKDWDKTFALNARATARLITMLDPLLKAASGAWAVMASDRVAGKAYYGAYGASKAAADALWTSWRDETAPLGLRVVDFTPAPMPTALRARFFPGEDRDGLASCDAQAAAMIKDCGLAG